MRALTNGGITLIATGRLDDAIILFRHAVEVEPRSPSTRRLLGLALLDRGDFEGAAAQAREGVTLTPGDREMRDLLERALAAGRGTQRR